MVRQALLQKNMLDAKKIKEWHKWGKEFYKSTVSMIKHNSHHPDYNTPEKIKSAIDKAIDNHYNFTKTGKERLKTKWNYTDEDMEVAKKALIDGFNASRKWYEKADKKFQKVIDEYKPTWEEAERLANSTDVSDIKDGFPCGSAHLYLDNYPEGEELRKALGHFANNSSDTPIWKYRLPIKMPSYGQCIEFDERICGKVREFLRQHGIFTNIHSWID